MRRVIGSVVLLGMLALTGCGGGDPLPTLPPTPTATPVFASEEEALAAAEAAYAAYSEVSDLIAAEGGSDPDRLAPYVTAEQLDNERETAEFFRSNKIHAVGRATTTKVVLQQYSEVAGGAEIVAYVCVDVSGVAIVDAVGNDVTPVDRPEIASLEVLFVGEAADQLLIASSEQWSDTSFC